jgi:Na+-driven multidrug efflux pump
MSNTAVLNSHTFTDRMFRRLFWPTLMSAIGWALGDIADALFVGIRLGKVGLATMSLVAPVYMIYNVLDVGFAVGASVKYAHALGKGDAKEGINIFSQMTVVCVVTSIVIGLVGLLTMPYILRFLGAGSPRGALWSYTRQYLQIMFIGAPFTFLYFLLYYCIRCDDNEKLASAGYTIGFLTDVVASAVFIMGFKLDVRGAIYATVLGKMVGVIIFLFHFTRKWTILRFRFVKPEFKKILAALRTGMSSSFGYIGQFITLIVVNNLLLRIGGSGTLAVFNVVQDVSYVALAIYTALGDTVQPLSATFYAEHNRAAIKRIMQLGMVIGVVSGGVIALLFALFAPSICELFGLSGTATSTGTFAVRLFCLSVIPAGLNIIWSSCFQAIKKERIVFLINQLRTFVCFLLFALLFSVYGFRWFWLTFLCAEVMTLIIWAPLAYTKRQTDTSRVFTYLLDTNSADISDLLAKAEAFCEANNANMKQSYCVSLCVEEICQAIIENAFNQKGDEYIQLTLCFEKNGTVVIHIRDNAVSFNPFDMKTGKDYDDDEQLASLGIQMVKSKSKQFFYRRYSGFNTLTVEVE